MTPYWNLLCLTLYLISILCVWAQHAWSERGPYILFSDVSETAQLISGNRNSSLSMAFLVWCEIQPKDSSGIIQHRKTFQNIQVLERGPSSEHYSTFCIRYRQSINFLVHLLFLFYLFCPPQFLSFKNSSYILT